MNIVNWNKKFNENSETYEIRIDFEDGTLISSNISIDDPNFQEWENHAIFQNTFERLSIYHFLNRR